MSAPSILVLAGLDPSGGAGLLADAEAVRTSGGSPLCVATALTVQTRARAYSFQPVAAELVREAARRLLEEEPVRAVKIGMIGNAAVGGAIEELLAGVEAPVVIDPVLAASSGAPLFAGTPEEAREAYLRLARGRIITPNLPEAEALLGAPPDAGSLLAKGPRAVLLKGGHAGGDVVVDVLAVRGGRPESFSAPRLPQTARGTGCRLASALATWLGRGKELREAVLEARALVRSYIAQTP